uniref:Neutral alpha-glucosidase AB n=1 Tax=Ganoderma boninense TaxID=34458 RepID=A0A5K1JYC3_9APHY|nr:Neutral alpha-glucosidase AB [Ganoderma boninense]
MRDRILDANFPRTLDQRVYHLGLRAGEVANRIITLGAPSRAHGIASYLDPTPTPFEITSERGFTTITGRYKGVPVSIIAIGMGYPNADFFVREPPEITTSIVDHTLNASADSFYSSQGRQTSFPDHNADLIPRLVAAHKDLATLEMETFHILHLAACWDIGAKTGSAEAAPPLQHAATAPSIPPVHAPSTQTRIPDVAASATGAAPLSPPPRIRAAAAQMVFASRTSQDFITPQEVAAIEAWAGRAVLEALVGLEIEPDRLHEEVGSVWERKDGAEAVRR